LNQVKQKLIIIAGPTASSKSEIALYLAENLNGEIINADSVQVYRYFDIGSAKPSLEERRKIPHHLIDILLPDEEFNAFKFKELAQQAVTDIAARGKVPIVAGGTGLYIRCFLYDLFTQDEAKIKKARKHWESVCTENGLPFLYNHLKKVDMESAGKIHPNDKIRIVRALEFYSATSTPISMVHKTHGFEKSQYDFSILVPDYQRNEVARRIENRSREMFQNGIVEEIRHILSLGYSKDIKPFKSIGYKEALSVLDKKITVDEGIALTIKNTKAYAKRQRVWFKKEKNVCHIPMDTAGFDPFYYLFIHQFLFKLWGVVIMNVQDIFLNQLRKDRVKVLIEVSGGENYTGIVKGFDNFCIFMQTDEGHCLLYKHALTKIVPPKDFVLKPNEREFVRKP
jgi:tRNA dimethylallyltransferase